MRFFLDNDVDVAVAAMLRRGGHHCWTASDAKLADATDEALAIYAQRVGAVLVSHDRVFAARRSRNTLDQHVWLDCPHPDAAAVLTRHLDAVVQILSRHPNVVIRVTIRSVKTSAGWQ